MNGIFFALGTDWKRREWVRLGGLKRLNFNKSRFTTGQRDTHGNVVIGLFKKTQINKNFLVLLWGRSRSDQKKWSKKYSGQRYHRGVCWWEGTFRYTSSKLIHTCITNFFFFFFFFACVCVCVCVCARHNENKYQTNGKHDKRYRQCLK